MWPVCQLDFCHHSAGAQTHPGQTHPGHVINDPSPNHPCSIRLCSRFFIVTRKAAQPLPALRKRPNPPRTYKTSLRQGHPVVTCHLLAVVSFCRYYLPFGQRRHFVCVPQLSNKHLPSAHSQIYTYFCSTFKAALHLTSLQPPGDVRRHVRWSKTSASTPQSISGSEYIQQIAYQ